MVDIRAVGARDDYGLFYGGIIIEAKTVGVNRLGYMGLITPFQSPQASANYSGSLNVVMMNAIKEFTDVTAEARQTMLERE